MLNNITLKLIQSDFFTDIIFNQPQTNNLLVNQVTNFTIRYRHHYHYSDRASLFGQIPSLLDRDETLNRIV